MNDCIYKIAKVNKRDRFDAIVSVLTENGISYNVQSLPFNGALGNVTVTFNHESTEKKTAVTAHYDASMQYGGTPGANDNAAACSILLDLILETKKNGTDRHLEFVFFDLEESGFLGSRYYLEQNRDSLLGIFNLDMCGMGSNTVVSLHNNAEEIFPHARSKDVHILGMLPPGDAYTFIDAGVPTVYVINSTDRDLSWFREFAKTGRQPCGFPDFARTMHKPNDTPDTCDPDQIEKITRYVYSCIHETR